MPKKRIHKCSRDSVTFSFYKDYCIVHTMCRKCGEVETFKVQWLKAYMETFKREVMFLLDNVLDDDIPF